MSPTAAATSESSVLDAVPTGLAIGGQFRAASDGGTFDVLDPATGATLVSVANATVEDGAAALDAAVAAQADWAATSPRERGEILRRAFELVMDRRDELALLMTLEMGKPVAESLGEVTYSAEFLRWFSEEAVRISGTYGVSPDGNGRVLTMRQPVGPCLFITPWNFPLAMGARKIAPAVAAGCTMVVKPAQQTPLSMLKIAEIFSEAGLPDGVLNVVPTNSASRLTKPLISDPRLRKLSFTGSTSVGQTLIAASAENVLRVSMELGGNAPFLVFEDADIDAAVEGAMIAKMRNMGEACTAANRFYVHESVAEEFGAALAKRMGGLTLGRGTDEGVDVGPLIDEAGRDKVVELVGDAVERGAEIAVGGQSPDGDGFFYAPTVLTGVPRDARLLHEEIFGPVAPIVTFSDDDDAIAAANDTEYGLVAYVFTRDLERAFHVIERLDVGMVGLNAGKVSNAAAPFGGVKQSGLGREGGAVGIDEFLETKYVALTLG